MLHDLKILLQNGPFVGDRAVICEQTASDTLLISTRYGAALGIWRETAAGLTLTLVAYGVTTHSADSAEAAAEVTWRWLTDLTTKP